MQHATLHARQCRMAALHLRGREDTRAALCGKCNQAGAAVLPVRIEELCREPRVCLPCVRSMVPEMSKKYFPEMAVGFSDPRVKVHICDGIKFVQVCRDPCLHLAVLLACHSHFCPLA